MKRLGLIVCALAVSVGCEGRFWGELHQLEFGTNLVHLAPSHAVAEGAAVRFEVTDVATGLVGWEPFDAAATGTLDLVATGERAFEIRSGRGRIEVTSRRGDETVEDRFPVRFESPREVLVDGLPRLGVVADAPCAVELSVHGRRGARLSHDPTALDVAGDKAIRVWEAEGSRIELAAGAGAVGRLDVRYGTFGPVPAPEVVGVALADVVDVAIRAEPYGEGTLLVPVGAAADGTRVACVPVAWEIPEGVVFHPGDPGEDGTVPLILVEGSGIPEGVTVSIVR